MSAATTPIASLFAIEDMDVQLRVWFDETEGEVTPELAELESWLADQRDRKIEGWGLFLERLEGEAEQLAKVEKRVAARRKALENLHARRKENLRAAMERLGIKQVKGPVTALIVARQLNNPKVVGELSAAQLEELWTKHPSLNVVRFVPSTLELDRKRALELLQLAAADEGEAHALPAALREQLRVVREDSLRLR